MNSGEYCSHFSPDLYLLEITKEVEYPFFQMTLWDDTEWNNLSFSAVSFGNGLSPFGPNTIFLYLTQNLQKWELIYDSWFGDFVLSTFMILL